MKQTHTYFSEAPAEGVFASLTPNGTATSLLSLTESEPIDTEGGPEWQVTEVTDVAPHKAEYGCIVEALIALRYTTGAEIALSRKPDTDAEKAEYLAFVEACKAEAHRVLEEAGA